MTGDTKLTTLENYKHCKPKCISTYIYIYCVYSIINYLAYIALFNDFPEDIFPPIVCA